MLIGLFGPFPRASPGTYICDARLVGGVLIPTQVEVRSVIARDPKNVVSRGWRQDQGSESLPVGLSKIGRCFKKIGDDVGFGGAVREGRGARQVRDRAASNSGVQLTKNAIDLGVSGKGESGQQEGQNREIRMLGAQGLNTSFSC